MRNILLTDKQYSRIKDFIVENEIYRSLLNEQKFQINQQNATATSNEDIVVPQISLDSPGVTIKKGSKFSVSKKGNITSNANVEWIGGKKEKTFVVFYCKSKTTQVGNKKYPKFTGKNQSFNSVIDELCKLVNTKNNLSKTYGTEAVGGGMGYTQKYDQPITSQDNKKMTIPKGTGFVPKKDGAGASFKLGNDFGWFDCNTKNFVINKVKYTSDTLSKTLSAKLCKSETPTPNVVGGGGGTTPGSGGGGGSSTALPPDIDLYI